MGNVGIVGFGVRYFVGGVFSPHRSLSLLFTFGTNLAG